jgi:hypothetical protein
MYNDIKHHITKVCQCLKAKKPNKNFRAPLQELTATVPFERVSIDFLHLEKSKGGYEYILLIVDNFTRFSQAYATKNKSATTAAKHLFQDFILRFGAPARIHHDQGREFENNLFHTLERIYGISRSRTTSYHPEGNGQVERLNRTLLQMLRTLPESNKPNWKNNLNHLVHAYNCTKHDATGFSPYFLLFGRKPRLPIDFLLNEELTEEQHKSYEQQITDFKASMREAHRIAAQNSQRSKDDGKKRRNLTKYVALEVGDRVLVKNVREKGGPGKIRAYWETDIYKIIGIKDEVGVVYEVVPERNPKAKPRVLHRNMLLPCDHLPLETPTPRTPTPRDTITPNAPHSEESEESDQDDDQLTTNVAYKLGQLAREIMAQAHSTPRLTNREEPTHLDDEESESTTEEPVFNETDTGAGSSTDEDTEQSSEEDSQSDAEHPTTGNQHSRRPVRQRFPRKIFTYDQKGNPTYETLSDAYHNGAGDESQSSDGAEESATEEAIAPELANGRSSLAHLPPERAETDYHLVNPNAATDDTPDSGQPHEELPTVTANDRTGNPTYSTMRLSAKSGTWV